MKLTEKLTDEEVDEMILETDVDDTQCSEQIVDVPSSQDRRKNGGNYHSTPREQIPERVVARIVNMSELHTQSGGEDRDRFSVSQQVANAQDAKVVSRHDPALNW